MRRAVISDQRDGNAAGTAADIEHAGARDVETLQDARKHAQSRELDQNKK